MLRKVEIGTDLLQRVVVTGLIQGRVLARVRTLHGGRVDLERALLYECDNILMRHRCGV